MPDRPMLLAGLASPAAAAIRLLNDQLRTTGTGGAIVISRGVAALGPAAVAAIQAAVRAFDTFGAGNDPYGEHDFGSFLRDGEWIVWKIDYYDSTGRRGSPDPANPAVTTRVLTIMLAAEY